MRMSSDYQPREYYNEINPYAAQWLLNLSDQNHIGSGFIDHRCIREIGSVGFHQFERCHFFAGIGVWSYALRAAGWPAGREIWTGSCPCQPFSIGGKREGFEDPRHLWPVWFDIIRAKRPFCIIGEQVASPDGRAWLDIVQTDLENTEYAFGAVIFPAAALGAPHWRERIYWMAYALDGGRARAQQGRRQGQGIDGSSGLGELANHRGAGSSTREPQDLSGARRGIAGRAVAERGAIGQLGNAELIGARREPGAGFEAERGARLRPIGHHAGSSSSASGVAGAVRSGRPEGRAGAGLGQITGSGATGQLGNAELIGARREPGDKRGEESARGEGRSIADRSSDVYGSGPTNGFWRDADWIRCRDGKWRPIEPGTFPLADGAFNRVGQLCAYGNAIVAPQAVEFCKVVKEITDEL